MFNNLNFNDFLLNDWYSDLFDNLFDLLNFNDLLDDLLNNLRNLYNLFNDSWHNHYSFNNFLNFNNFWHLYHFFNDLVHMNSDFFNPLNHTRNLNNLFDNHFHWYLLSDVFNNSLWNFCHLNDLYYLLNNFFHLNNSHSLIFLRNNLLNDFRYNFYLLLNNWNLNSFFDYFFNLFDQRNNFLNNFLNFFYPISVNNLLLNHLNFFNSWHLTDHFHYLLHNLRHLFDFLNSLNNRNNSFNNSFNYLRYMLNMVNCLSSRTILNSIDNLLNDFLNFNYHWLLNNPFYYLFNNFLNFNYPFLDLFDNNCLVLNDFNLFNLRYCMVYNLFDNNWLLNLNNFFSNHLNLNYFWYFYSSLHYLLNYLRYFNDLLFNLLNLNDFFNYFINVFNHLNGDVNNFFNFLNLSVVHYLFHNLLNWNHNRDFHNSVNHFLNNLRNLDNFMVYLEGLQDIIYINSATDLLINHSNNSLIDLRGSASLQFHSLELIKQGTKKYSQVEFNSPLLISIVSVHILNFHN